MTVSFKEFVEAEQKIKAYTKNDPPAPYIIDIAYPTDEGNAQWFAQLHSRNLRYVRKWDTWMVWNGKIWVSTKSKEMSPYVKELANQMHNQAKGEVDNDKAEKLKKQAIALGGLPKIKACIELAQNQECLSCEPEEFDNKPMLFNVQNGTIDLVTGTLREHRREDSLTQICRHEYHPERNNPTNWLKFLDDLFGDHPGIIEYLHRKFGYILTGDTSEEEIDILQGLGGNGKSKMIGAIAYVMGSDYYEKVNIETIQSSSIKKSGGAASPDVACLKNKRYITTAEPENNIVLNMALLKDFTGRDPLKARGLFQKPETFMPVFKLQIPTNFDLILKTQDVGTWRRLKKLPFSKQITKINKHLDELLKAEAVEILSWMVEGCIKWQSEGLKVPEEIIKATQDYKDEMDSLSDFFTLWCEHDNSAYVLTNTAYDAYCLYCSHTKEYQLSKVAFSKALKERGLAVLDREKGHRILKYMRLNLKALEAVRNPESIPYELLGKLPVPSNGKVSNIVSRIDDKLKDELDGEFGVDKPTAHEVDAYLRIYHEKDISDEGRAKIVGAYCAPPVVTGQDQRGKLRELREIIRSSQNGNGAELDIIISKASAYGITKEIAEDMLAKLKSAGDVIEVSHDRYRVV